VRNRKDDIKLLVWCIIHKQKTNSTFIVAYLLCLANKVETFSRQNSEVIAPEAISHRRHSFKTELGGGE
jgi:hypothetical protein